jgi:hypothetical protein
MASLRHYATRTRYSRRVRYRAVRTLVSMLAVVMLALATAKVIGA